MQNSNCGVWKKKKIIVLGKYNKAKFNLQLFQYSTTTYCAKDEMIQYGLK